jgi:hypothetical protein
VDPMIARINFIYNLVLIQLTTFILVIENDVPNTHPMKKNKIDDILNVDSFPKF